MTNNLLSALFNEIVLERSKVAEDCCEIDLQGKVNDVHSDILKCQLAVSISEKENQQQLLAANVIGSGWKWKDNTFKYSLHS